MQNGFLEWYRELRSDARQKGCQNRISCRSAKVWNKVYREGVDPTILSVLAWAVARPERFNQLRETENPVIYVRVQYQERLAA